MKRLAILVLSVMPGVAIAALPVIGTVTAGGAFRLNGDTVIGNGTLTEGSLLETGRDVSSVRLTGGARLSLGADTRGQLYRDHMILAKGEIRLESGAGFRLEALGLTVRPDRTISTARIALLGSNRVRVAALTGRFRVLNARGALVANISAGSALVFEPQAPAAAAVTHITGTLTQQSGHFLLTDQVTHVTVEVTGQGLQANVGQVVQVTGTVNASAAPVAGATQVIAATSVQTVAAGAATGGAAGGAAGGATGGATGGAAAAGAGGAAAGVGIGVTTIAIVGGVAAAATLGGLAASGALPGQSSGATESR